MPHHEERGETIHIQCEPRDLAFLPLGLITVIVVSLYFDKILSHLDSLRASLVPVEAEVETVVEEVVQEAEHIITPFEEYGPL